MRVEKRQGRRWHSQTGSYTKVVISLSLSCYVSIHSTTLWWIQSPLRWKKAFGLNLISLMGSQMFNTFVYAQVHLQLLQVNGCFNGNSFWIAIKEEKLDREWMSFHEALRIIPCGKTFWFKFKLHIIIEEVIRCSLATSRYRKWKDDKVVQKF